MDLFKTYGRAIIPAGTLLFRKSDVSTVLSEMYFAFNPYGVESSSNSIIDNRRIQFWRTRIDIEALYMVKEVINDNKITALEDIWNYYFPEEPCGYYIDVKASDSEKRRKLLSKLKSFHVFEWVTSIENGFDMELFLFGGKDFNNSKVYFEKECDFRSLSDKILNIESFNHVRIRHK